MKAWRLADPFPDLARDLAGLYGFPDALGQALVNRGIRTPESADRFLRPRLSSLHNPNHIPGMPAAVDRIGQALRHRERVLVFGDYDVDGLTATAVLARVFTQLGARVRTFIPDRIRDGYGLNAAVLKRCLAAEKADLVVTVDCGTNAVEAARTAREMGVDLVITDHHQPVAPVPEAVAVVNPRYASKGPCLDLAGVGVAFKVVHAVLKRLCADDENPRPALDLRAFLDWVALGTVADAVPLTGENRVLVRHGLYQAVRSPSPAVAALSRIAGIEGNLEAWHLAFALGPRLNAAGRLGSADRALTLLLCSDTEQALNGARELDRMNRERQQREKAVLQTALKQAQEQGPEEEWLGRVSGGVDWHPGVLGIVAARLSKHFHQPAIVFSLRSDGTGRGSGRAPDGFNLLQAVGECSTHLDRFGGHAAAVGLELKAGRIDAFRASFFEAVSRQKPGPETAVLKADAWLGLEDADERLLNSLDQFRPFGQGNPAPLWLAEGVQVLATREIGGGRHRSFRLANGGVERSAVGFNMGGREAPPARIDVLFEVRRNTFAGRTHVQLHLRDWRPALR